MIRIILIIIVIAVLLSGCASMRQIPVEDYAQAVMDSLDSRMTRPDMPMVLYLVHDGNSSNILLQMIPSDTLRLLVVVDSTGSTVNGTIRVIK